jgi:type III pantothenate kinase
MNICIDAGNSRVKFGIFDEDNLCEVFIHQSMDINYIESVYEKYQFTRGLICGSRHIEKEVLSQLADKYDIRILTHNTPLPIKNLYRTPESLGKDRLAGAVGGHFAFPFYDNLIIDLGTANTYNYVNQRAEFFGGNIAPGLAMRINLLHQGTDKLPMVSLHGEVNLYGMDTESALRNGAILGTIAEIEYYKKRFSEQYSAINIILTGGNAGVISHYLQNSYVIKPDLVLEGLNKILLHNA